MNTILKKSTFVTTFLLFIRFHFPQLFYCSACLTAVSASLHTHQTNSQPVLYRYVVESSFRKLQFRIFPLFNALIPSSVFCSVLRCFYCVFLNWYRLLETRKSSLEFDFEF